MYVADKSKENKKSSITSSYTEGNFEHKGMQRGRLVLCKGNIYSNVQNNRQCELIEYIDDGVQVVIKYIDDLSTEIISIKQLENIQDIYNQHISVDLSDISDEYWAKAQAKYEAIRPLLQSPFDSHMIGERAQAVGVTKRTIYRWLQAYNTLGSIAGLVDRKRGWQEGNSRLTIEQDNLIKEVIEQFYLQKQRPTMEQTIREVYRKSIDKKITKPSKGSIRLRISQISERERLRKRGQKEKAKQKFSPTPNHFPNADYPLSVVQIDHTPVDLILVDNKYRKPIGRPFLTLAIDVYSRVITGYYLSLDAPSVTSVGMCITRSILSKDKLLSEHGINDVDWNVYGYPNKIHVDNGADFRSINFAKSCEAHGITLEFRPVARPQYGGHIERLIGTFMKEIHGINGTTFSNIKERDSYNSENEASLTLAEFEIWLLTFITKVYHKRVHSALGRSPIEQWKIGVFGNAEILGIGMPAMPQDEITLFLDFLPCIHRTIQHFGVTIDGLRYYDQCLNLFINDSDSKGNKKRFIFRRDPRDISRIWFYDPLLKKYFVVPFANQKLPSLSLWEYDQARKNLKDKGNVLFNDDQIYSALTEMREIIQVSSQNTKKARRLAQRSKQHKNIQQSIERQLLNPGKIDETPCDAKTMSNDNSLLVGEIDFGYVEVD